MRMASEKGDPIHDRKQLQQHVLATYFTLRWGLVAIAIALPLVLWALHRWGATEEPLKSMSHSYWLLETNRWFSGRAVFVGGLFAIAAGLYLYKGYTRKENVALNVAAVLLIVVALFPTELNCSSDDMPIDPSLPSYCFPGLNPHGPSAIAAFLILGYVVFFRAHDSLTAIRDRRTRAFFGRAFELSAIAMVALPVAALALHWLRHEYSTLTFWLEAAGIFAFAIFWALKSLEMRRSFAEERAAEGQGLAPQGRVPEPGLPRVLSR